MPSSLIDKSFHLVLYHHDQQVRKVQVHSSASLDVQNLLIGRPPEDVCPLLSKFFLTGSFAQSHVAMMALNQAYGFKVESNLQKARTLLVLVEQISQQLAQLGRATGESGRLEEGTAALVNMEEQLFRRTPPFKFGARMLQTDFASFTEAAQKFALWFQEVVWGQDQHLMGRLLPAQINDWAQNSEALAPRMLRRQESVGAMTTPSMKPLPWVAIPDWHRMFDSSDAAQLNYLPTLNGVCYETGAFARQAQHAGVVNFGLAGAGGLSVRTLAQLIDLNLAVLHLAQGPDITPFPLGGKPKNGVGLVQAETVRGRLVHRVKLSGDKISRYQILAPAQWNFHPKGVVAEGLTGVHFESKPDLTEQAVAWCKAIDPFTEPDIQIKPLDHLP